MKIKTFVLGEYQTNCYLVYDEDNKDAFIVDPGYESQNLIDEIKKNELKPQYIILTHGHGDHTGGIDFVKSNFPEIKLVASKLEKKFLYNRHASQGKGGIVADIDVSDEEHLKVGNMDLRFISTPGHTPGGMCILVDSILFSGDTLFCCSIGRTDLDGGNTLSLLTSIKEKLMVLDEEIQVLPGHDRYTKIGYEKRYNPWL